MNADTDPNKMIPRTAYRALNAKLAESHAEVDRLRTLLGWARPMLAEASRMLTTEHAYNPEPLVEQIARFDREPEIIALSRER